jgi:hypothetical protein
MVSTQLEYRLELPKRFGIVGFGGIGEVVPGGDQLFRSKNFLAGGGGRVRFVLSKQYHVNLRADAAVGKNGHTWAMGVGGGVLMRFPGLEVRPASAEVTLRRRCLVATQAARMSVLFLTVMTLVTLAVLPLFAGTQILRRWVLTGQPMPNLKKILVLAVVENYLIRQHFEDEVEKLLGNAGVVGVKSHMVLPP